MIPAAMGSPPTNTNATRERGEGASKNTTTAFSYPSPSSVKGRVLSDLLSGYKLTHYDVWENHGSSRASHHVLMLRKAGFPVITDEIDVPTSDGRTARIALYSLSRETVDATGERGEVFIAESVAARKTKQMKGGVQ